MKMAYKLVRLRKDGSIGPLFINRKLRLLIDEWMEAEDHPTKGFAHRMGWHVTEHMSAPHLSKKGRIWIKVAIKNYEVILRPESQGGKWFLAQQMKVLEVNPTEGK
jgi:hypothetical protein